MAHRSESNASNLRFDDRVAGSGKEKFSEDAAEDAPQGSEDALSGGGIPNTQESMNGSICATPGSFAAAAAPGADQHAAAVDNGRRPHSALGNVGTASTK